MAEHRNTLEDDPYVREMLDRLMEALSRIEVKVAKLETEIEWLKRGLQVLGGMIGFILGILLTFMMR